MPYDFGDVSRMIKDAAVGTARQQGGLLSGTLATVQAGANDTRVVNGYWDDDGTWVERPTSGIIFFGPPGFAG